MRAKVQQVIQLGGDKEQHSVVARCLTDAQPKAQKFAWSLVSMGELIDWAMVNNETKQAGSGQYELGDFLTQRRQDQIHWKFETQTG